MELRRKTSTVLVLAVAVGLLLSALALAGAPGATAEFWSKEGLSEQISHLVLAVAIVVWVAGARRWRRVGPLVMAVFFLLILLEELEDLQQYGLGWLSFDLHNAWDGAAYALFAFPLLVYYGAALVPVSRRALVGRVFGPAAATRAEAFGFGWVGVITVLAPLLFSELEPQFDELCEFWLYALLLVGGVRGLGAEAKVDD